MKTLHSQVKASSCAHLTPIDSEIRLNRRFQISCRKPNENSSINIPKFKQVKRDATNKATVQAQVALQSLLWIVSTRVCFETQRQYQLTYSTKMHANCESRRKALVALTATSLDPLKPVFILHTASPAQGLPHRIQKSHAHARKPFWGRPPFLGSSPRFLEHAVLPRY